MANYMPELGQMAFGQLWQDCKPSILLECLLESMCVTIDILLGVKKWPSGGNQFSNSGAPKVSINRFTIESYSWDEDYDQPFNLEWNDVQISWYKHCARGVSVNRKVSDKEVCQMMLEWNEDIALWVKWYDTFS